VVVHIVCAVAYAILGAFQFSGALRRRLPGWHRVAGRVLVVLGLGVAFSALWMTLFYPRAPGGELAYAFRLAFGSGMAATIILGFDAIRRGDVARHRTWMARAYALSLGAGTQVFTLGVANGVFGISELSTALGWARAGASTSRSLSTSSAGVSVPAQLAGPRGWRRRRALLSPSAAPPESRQRCR
jgi:uncharacterized membrane protein